jgi:hypothetical protein
MRKRKILSMNRSLSQYKKGRKLVVADNKYAGAAR